MKPQLNPFSPETLPVQYLTQIEHQEHCMARLAMSHAAMPLEADRIWQATNGAIDILIAGIREDGLAEATAMLKQRKPQLQAIAVELVSHRSLADTHPDFGQPLPTSAISTSLRPSWGSDVILVRDDEAVVIGRRLARSEGLRDDIVTCTMLCAAVRAGQSLDSKGKLIVIFPSTLDRVILPLNHPWR